MSDSDPTPKIVLPSDAAAPAGDQGYESIVSFAQPASGAAEDYRSIRSALAMRWFRHPEGEKTLAIVSPQRGDGRSELAANLGVCMAKVGFTTLLIDADLRHPALHTYFNCANDRGLASYLEGVDKTLPVLAIDALPSLFVIPAGYSAQNPQELFMAGRLDELIAQAKTKFDAIIFDTPAAAEGADYQLIGAAARGALVVTRAAKTTGQDARKVVDDCREFGIRVVGTTTLGVN